MAVVVRHTDKKTITIEIDNKVIHGPMSASATHLELCKKIVTLLKKIGRLEERLARLE